MHVAAVLAHDVIHRGRVPRSRLGRLLLAEVDAELVLICRGAALLVGRPRVRFIAAADDAVVARDVELLGVLRDDRETVNLTLVSHDDFSSQHVGQAAVQKFVHAFGVDVALAVDAQHVLRKILRGLAPDLLATGLAVEARVMPGAVHCFIRGVVIERKTLVWTDGRKADDVTVSADAARDAAVAGVGAIEATATPAAARPAPLMNLRRPTSTIRSQRDMVRAPRMRQYAYWRASSERSVRLPAGALAS